MITHRYVIRFAATAAAATSLGLAALAAASAASAGSVDDAFLADLSSEGIGYDSAKLAISNAHTVCSRLDGGESASSIGAEILQNTNLTTRQAAAFVVSSVSSYCPQHSGQFT